MNHEVRARLAGALKKPFKSLPLVSPVDRLDCTHRGDLVGYVDCKKCGGRVQNKVFTCAVYGECVIGEAVPGKGYCRTCSDRTSFQGSSTIFEWVSTSQLVLDAIKLAAMAPANCAGVVGVPRSGMLPASVVATHLHLPLFSLGENGPAPIKAGSRGGTLHKSVGPLLVVDDTVYGGSAMKRARIAMHGHPAIFSAVYARPQSKSAADLYVRELPSPHLLEWNFASNGPVAGHAANPVYGRGVAFDLDGVICHDEHSGGPVGKPYLLPRMHPIRLIATGRPESTRLATIAWLRAHAVRFERLEMLPDETPLTLENAARHKAKYYVLSGCGFFVESDPAQAGLIHEMTQKPVICPRAGKVFQ